MKTSRSEVTESKRGSQAPTLENMTFGVADLKDAIRVQEDDLCRMKYSRGEEEFLHQAIKYSPSSRTVFRNSSITLICTSEICSSKSSGECEKFTTA